jgi:HD-GYP domain-containing protein (c-di-GMP phosphodiesterase class II)
VGQDSTRRLMRYLPEVTAATFVVAICPILVVSALRAAGIVGSVILSAALGIVLSLGLSWLGSAYWKQRSRSEDVLFGDLMIWGWLQRWWSERRRATAVELLGRDAGTGDLSPERQARLVAQLAGALEARDPYTHGHSQRVARYASMISKRMGLSSGEVARIRTAAAVHDVGKINVPKQILHKPERLTDEEFAIIRCHTVDGARIVELLGDEKLTSIVRHHHERLDGTGYPDALAGDAIPLGARIIAVADTFDAVTSTRPYRRANPHKKAIDILTKKAGTQLDLAAVRAFRSCYSGRRPLVLWSGLSNLPDRLSSWLGGAANPATALPITNAIATAATVAAVGSAAASTTLSATPRAARPVETVAVASLAQAHNAQPGRSTTTAVQRFSGPVADAATSPPRGSSSTPGTAGLVWHGRAGSPSSAGAGLLSSAGAGLLSSAGAGLPSSAGAGLPSSAGAGLLSSAGAGSPSSAGAGSPSSAGAGSPSSRVHGSGQGQSQGHGQGGGQGQGQGQGGDQGHAGGGQGQGQGSSQGQGQGQGGDQGHGLGGGQGQGQGSGQGQGQGQGQGGDQGQGQGRGQGHGKGQGGGQIGG